MSGVFRLFNFGAQDAKATSLGPPKITEENRSTILRALAHICLADGRIDPSEIAQIAEAYQAICADTATPEQVRRAVESARTDPRPLWDALAAAASELGRSERLAVLASAAAVASSDGEVASTEQDKLRSYGRALGLDSEDIDRLLAPA